MVPEQTVEQVQRQQSDSMSAFFNRHNSMGQLYPRGHLLRQSFVSKEDFRMSTDGAESNPGQILQTPTKSVKSRTTQQGRADHAEAKNQPILAVNDSISSNQTRPSHDRLIGRDGPQDD